jgi:hypothetical protein
MRQSLRIVAVLASRFGNFTAKISSAVKSGNAPNHLQVLLHPGTAIPMSGAVSGMRVSQRLSSE